MINSQNMTTCHIRHCILFAFQLKKNAAEVAKIIWSALIFFCFDLNDEFERERSFSGTRQVISQNENAHMSQNEQKTSFIGLRSSPSSLPRLIHRT